MTSFNVSALLSVCGSYFQNYPTFFSSHFNCELIRISRLGSHSATSLSVILRVNVSAFNANVIFFFFFFFGRKKLRNEIGKQFPALSADDLSALVPNKEDMTIMKISTYSGQNLLVYNLHGNPAFFQIETQVYPTGKFFPMVYVRFYLILKREVIFINNLRGQPPKLEDPNTMHQLDLTERA